MNRTSVTFLRGLVVLWLVLVHPVPVRAAESMIVGVAGPAINMVYSFVARDAASFRSTASMSASWSLMLAPFWPRRRFPAR